MVFGFIYKLIAGSIFTTFAVIPAITEPKAFTESLIAWWGNFSPVIHDLIGRAVLVKES